MKAKDWRGLAYAVLAAQLPRLLGVALAAEGGRRASGPGKRAQELCFGLPTPPPSHSPCYAGLAMKFLPTGSHRTKDAAGQLIHNALILRSIGGLYQGIVGGGY